MNFDFISITGTLMQMVKLSVDDLNLNMFAHHLPKNVVSTA